MRGANRLLRLVRIGPAPAGAASQAARSGGVGLRNAVKLAQRKLVCAGNKTPRQELADGAGGLCPLPKARPAPQRRRTARREAPRILKKDACSKRTVAPLGSHLDPFRTPGAALGKENR